MRADAVIATTACTSKNGSNHFHLTRFCCRVCRGGGSDPPHAHNDKKISSTALIWEEQSPSGKDRNVQTQEGRAGSEEKDSTPLWLILSSYQCSTDPLCLLLSEWDCFDLTVVSLSGLSLFLFSTRSCRFPERNRPA